MSSVSVSDSSAPDFEEGVAYITPRPVHSQFVLELDGYAGPLDVLLSLAQSQKLDLAQISILQLAEQYLGFIDHIGDLPLEVAADYLVMASWLAYLKSRLLLPEGEDEDAVSVEAMAAYLVHRLKRLDAMRKAVEALHSGQILGRDVFMRGAPEGIAIAAVTRYDASFFELLAAYATRRAAVHHRMWAPPKFDVMSIEDARFRLADLIKTRLDEWVIFDELVSDATPPEEMRTTLASSFVAALEFARHQKIRLKQDVPFGDIMLRAARDW